MTAPGIRIGGSAMTDQERLEEINKAYGAVEFPVIAPNGKPVFFIRKDDADWLIAQAKKVERLEKNLELAESALQRISHYPFDYDYGVQNTLKEIAREGLIGGKSNG